MYLIPLKASKGDAGPSAKRMKLVTSTAPVAHAGLIVIIKYGSESYESLGLSFPLSK